MTAPRTAPRTAPGLCLLALLAAPATVAVAAFDPSSPQPAHTWAIAVHGGAGESEWEQMDAATALAYHQSLEQALAAGTSVLNRGGTAMDAVEASLRVLEDDPLFNAGRGSAFNAEGRNEMDAAIMDGRTLEAGSVAGVHFTRHPISLARAVMEHTPYVMMVGDGADAFSRTQGLEQQPPSFFFTEMRWQEFAGIMRKSGRSVPPRPAGAPPAPQSSFAPDLLPSAGAHYFAHRFGTTGAVARDRAGNIAAGTSTGGMQGKLPGRVGDSPIIGAGTYAGNASCAVSGTGVGEYFIRLTLARQVCTLVEQGSTPRQAADHMLHVELPKLKGGEGGVIVLTTQGTPVWSFNTLGMFRARQVEGTAPEIEVK